MIIALISAAPLLTTCSPTHLSDDLLVPPLSRGHFLGTTNMGEDVWSQILYGGRVSLKVGIVAAVLSGIIGVCLGGIAGYYGGIADKILTEITNIFLMTPFLFSDSDRSGNLWKQYVPYYADHCTYLMAE